MESGGFILKDGLPDEYYCFSDKLVSLAVERNGGLNSIKFWDVYEANGKLFPDNNPSPPIIEKEGLLFNGRPLYGPGLQFFSQLDSGRNLYHRPMEMRLFPFGFTSRAREPGAILGYDLCIDGDSVLFRFTNNSQKPGKWVAALSKLHSRSGDLASCKNMPVAELQNRDSQCFRPPGAGFPALNEDVPFLDSRIMRLHWTRIGFDKPSSSFIMTATLTFSYTEKKFFLVFKSDRPLSFSESRDKYILTMDWRKGKPIYLSMASSYKSLDDALAKAELKIRSFSSILKAKIKATGRLSSSAPKLLVPGLPSATVYAKAILPFEHAMLIAETGDESCIRAATEKYGYFPSWDQILATRAFTLAGDFKTAGKLVRYMATLPQGELLTMNNILLLPVAAELFGMSADTPFRRAVYPSLKRHLEFLAGIADANGLIRFNSTCGVDKPRELGLSGMPYPACLNGCWYAACRSMENIAIAMKDPETERLAGALSAKIAESYDQLFWDEAHGYLPVAVSPEDGRHPSVFQNVSTLPMDFTHGEFLLRRRIEAIADYQSAKLYHPLGRTAVAFDSPAHEMWKNVLMFQHLAHEAKIARAADDYEEAFRITKSYMDIFSRTLVGIETFNVSGMAGDISQRSNWQAFGARGGYAALVEGLVGIQSDLSSFRYVPASCAGTMKLSEYRFRNASWDIEFSGSGLYPSKFSIDGRSVPGTMRIPEVFFARGKRHSLRIVRSRTKPSSPILLDATDASISIPRSDHGVLEFSILNRCHSSLKIYAPFPCSVRSGKRELVSEYNAKSSILWVDLQATENTVITVEGR